MTRKEKITEIDAMTLLHRLIYNRNAESSFELQRRINEQEGGTSMRDFIRSLFRDELPLSKSSLPSTDKKPKPSRPSGQVTKLEADRERVINIRDGKNVQECVEIIMNSDWNFVDPRFKMKTTPQKVEEFLEELLDGQKTPMGELPDGVRGLMSIIVDSWLAWARMEIIRHKASA
jgi:hypothetical protein